MLKLAAEIYIDIACTYNSSLIALTSLQLDINLNSSGQNAHRWLCEGAFSIPCCTKGIWEISASSGNVHGFTTIK